MPLPQHLANQLETLLGYADETTLEYLESFESSEDIIEYLSDIVEDTTFINSSIPLFADSVMEYLQGSQ